MEHTQQEPALPTKDSAPHEQRRRRTLSAVAEARAAAEALLRQGVAVRAISRRLGIVRQTIYTWAAALGLSQPGSGHPRRDEASGLLREGLTFAEVFARTGVPYPVLRSWRAALGLPHRPVQHPRRAEAEALLRAGQSGHEISLQTGIPTRAIERWRRRLGLPRPPGPPGISVRRPQPRVSAPPRRDPRRDQAEALLRTGLTIPEAARQTGASISAVGGWRAALGLPRPRDPRRDQAEALLQAGLFIREAARQTGASITSVNRWRAALGLPRPRDPRRDQAEALLRTGLTVVEVARQTGASITSVGRWRAPLGLPRPRSQAPRRDQAEALMRSGVPIGTVSEQTGLSRRYLGFLRCRLGLAPDRPASLPPQIEEMLRQGQGPPDTARCEDRERATIDALLREGYHKRGVCRLLGVARDQVEERLRWLGLPDEIEEDEARWLALERMFLHGASVVRVARAIRMPVARICAFRRALGLDVRSRRRGRKARDRAPECIMPY